MSEMHKGFRWEGTIGKVVVSLELNNSKELAKCGATGLLESTQDWAVKAREAGVDETLKSCQKTQRSGHGWTTEFKGKLYEGEALKSGEYPLVLASSWAKREETGAAGSKLEEAFFELCKALLDAKKGVSNEVKEQIKKTLEPFEAEKKAREERKKAKIDNLAKTLAAMSESEKALLESLLASKSA